MLRSSYMPTETALAWGASKPIPMSEAPSSQLSDDRHDRDGSASTRALRLALIFRWNDGGDEAHKLAHGYGGAVGAG